MAEVCIHRGREVPPSPSGFPHTEFAEYIAAQLRLLWSYVPRGTRNVPRGTFWRSNRTRANRFPASRMWLLNRLRAVGAACRIRLNRPAGVHAKAPVAGF